MNNLDYYVYDYYLKHVKVKNINKITKMVE